MDFFRSLAIAFSMYSAIPMPQFQWDQKNYEHSFAFFPLVGAGLSAVLYFAYRGLGWLGTGSMAESLILTAIIVIYTGGFHIDGYMDTMDALCSHRSRDEKIQIMKDPHTGAFGVIQLLVLTLFMVSGIYLVIDRGVFNTLIYAFVISRALSGIAVCTFKRRDLNTSLIRFDTKGSRQFTLVMMFIYVFAVLAISFMNRESTVIIAALFCVIWFFISKLICEKEFGGISGDTSGYFLCICEVVFVWSVVLDMLLRARI